MYAQFTACCERLQMDRHPRAYIMNGDGRFNAFATKFLGTPFVVLYSDVVDAMAKHADGVRFYIGHELGHLRMKHLSGHFLRWPVLWLPLLGAAYSRARESTCDRHGLACSSSPEGAARALGALAAGPERWQHLDLTAYREQTRQTSGFWMSLHELLAGYPWVSKRVARVMNPEEKLPSRNVFSYFLAIFVPYSGRLGSGFGLLVMIYIIGLLAAVAIPAYQGYVTRAELSTDIAASASIREKLSSYYLTTHDIPTSLRVAGLPSHLTDGSKLSLDSNNMVLTLATRKGTLVFTPQATKEGKIIWFCSAGKGLHKNAVPLACRQMGRE